MLVHHRNSTALSPIEIGTADTFPKVPRGETAAAGAAEPTAGPNKAWDYRGGREGWGKSPFPLLGNVGGRASKGTRGGDSDGL